MAQELSPKNLSRRQRDVQTKEVSKEAQIEVQGILQTATQQPIAYAHVLSNIDSAYTDELGHFRVLMLSSDTLRCTHIGYETLRWAFPQGDRLVSAVSFPIVLILSPLVRPLADLVLRSLRADRYQSRSWAGVFLDRKTLAQHHMGQDLPFMLQELSPSLVVNSESGTQFSNYGALRLRGLGQENIGLTLEGIPLADMLDHGFYFSNMIDLTSSLSSVQITRGIGTTHHAVGAYAGAIHLRGPRLFDLPNQVELGLSGGSFGSWKASVGAQVRQGDVAAHLRFSRLQSQGWRQHSGTDGWSMLGAFGWRRSRQLFKVLVLTGQTRNELAYLPEAQSALEQTPRLNSLSSNETDRFNQSLLAWQHYFTISSKQRLGYTVYLGHAEGVFPFGYTTDTDTYTQLNYGLRNLHIGGFAQATLGNAVHQLQLGVHAYGFFRKNTEWIAPASNTLTYLDRTHKNEGSAFIKYAYAFGQWSLAAETQLRYLGIQFLPNAAYSPVQDIALPWWRYVFFLILRFVLLMT